MMNIPEGTSGDWAVSHFEITEAEAQSYNMRAAFRPGDRAVLPGKYSRITRNGQVIMSDTPAEIRDHAEFIRKATGSVLINGLGLGYCTSKVLAKPDVTDVTVIEASKDVIALVAPHLAEPRLTVIHANALEWRPPKGKRFDAVWHDIWDDICTDNLPEMATLHRRYGRCAGWQGSWARAICEYQRSRERRGSRWW